VPPELPLSPQVFQILLALAEGDRHGYAIIQDVEHETEGRIRLGPGTLYGALKRLVEAGWVRETARRPEASEDDQRRRYYTLTPPGRRVLASESERLASAVARARRAGILGAGGG